MVKSIELNVNYDPINNEVFLSAPNSSGAKYKVDPNNIAEDIGKAVERYISIYCTEEE